MAHEIVRCDCGATIRRCRCLGPHPVRILPRGCERCRVTGHRPPPPSGPPPGPVPGTFVILASPGPAVD